MKKILIANRSEIAVRIQATCHALDIQNVVIYSPEDKFLPYIYQANQNYPLSGKGASAYLNQDEIIRIAIETKADAIHPGYGFLAENAQFAQKVIDASLIWIGPDPECIKIMGNKIYARKLMQENNVKVIPGEFVSNNDFQAARKIAEQIGFPIILKNPKSGGGKGIRKVENKNEFINAWNLVVAQTTNSNEILIEKYIENGRHIEIQIAGDGKNCIHLFERECSIQRKHQKIIEETPCNFVDQKILEKMYKTAILAAKLVQYKNIGTVEFIVTPEQKFYFLEMNTRLQVEHGITELTTGLDLVHLQIQIAESEKLELKQNDISRKGHAIECRIYSEDPKNNFNPSTGTVTNLNLPHGPFIRHDHNLQENQEITPFFDSMLSKLITFGQTRELAIKNMLHALKQFNIDGIKTNINFLQKVLNSSEFLNGNFHTQLLNNSKFLEKLFDQKEEIHITEQEIALIAVTLFKNSKKSKPTNAPTNNWKKQQWQ